MRHRLVFALLPVLMATAASGKNRSYNTDSSDRGQIVSANPAPCETAAKSGKSTPAGVCQEYVIQGEHVLYHIRPAGTKHPVGLLPVGEVAEFRVVKDNKMMLRVLESDDEREHGFTVVSIMPHEADHTILLSSE